VGTKLAKKRDRERERKGRREQTLPSSLIISTTTLPLPACLPAMGESKQLTEKRNHRETLEAKD
jgi:hypothetical protein